MNWAQFKDPHCYLCLHGTVEACWFITQEVGGLNIPFCKNNFYRFCRFFRINLGKTRLWQVQYSLLGGFNLIFIYQFLKIKKREIEIKLSRKGGGGGWGLPLGPRGVKNFAIFVWTIVVTDNKNYQGTNNFILVAHFLLQTSKTMSAVFSWNCSRFEVTGFKKVHYGYEEKNSKAPGTSRCCSILEQMASLYCVLPCWKMQTNFANNNFFLKKKYSRYASQNTKRTFIIP